MLLKNKTALITGCNRGIGNATLKVFSENGADVFAHARKKTEVFERDCEDLSKKNGVEIIPIYFDLAESEEIKAGVKVIMQTKKPINILVNNAGMTNNMLFQMNTLEKVKEVFNINFNAPFLLSQYVVKLMVKYKKGGSIVNIASTAGQDGLAGQSSYGSSKAALMCLSKVIATEIGSQNIRVNAVAPGITKTDMVAHHLAQNIIEETIENTLLKRMANPEEIANTILFLASDMSSYITGQVLRVDGGLN